MPDKKSQINNLDITLMATYFFIPFYGLRIAMENYLMKDLDMSYLILLGIVGAIPASIYMAILKPRALKVKIIGLGILLAAVIITNLLVK